MKLVWGGLSLKQILNISNCSNVYTGSAAYSEVKLWITPNQTFFCQFGLKMGASHNYRIVGYIPGLFRTIIEILLASLPEGRKEIHGQNTQQQNILVEASLLSWCSHRTWPAFSVKKKKSRLDSVLNYFVFTFLYPKHPFALLPSQASNVFLVFQPGT